MVRRPTKDEYYYGIAKAVSKRSTCLRMHYGCVIVNNDEIVSTGYNGNPRGMENCIELQECSKEDKSHNSSPDSYNLCKSVHAEMNAIISAKRTEMIGAVMYLACFDMKQTKWVEAPKPCPICIRLIQNAGIAQVRSSCRAIWRQDQGGA